MYVTSNKAAEHYNVSATTLRSWAETGKIRYKLTEGGHRRYFINDIVEHGGKRKFIYCRVSSKKQEGDLKNQIKYLSDLYPEHEVISDIGSGISTQRPGFRTILECLFTKNLEEVIVTTTDRFSRFGFELFNGYFLNLKERLVQSYPDQTIFPATCSKLLQSLQQDTKANDVTRTRKIQFYPNSVQKNILNNFFGTYRLFYNAAAWYINNDPDYIESFRIPSDISIRDYLMKEADDEAWIKKSNAAKSRSSYDIAQEAISVCVANYRTGKTIHMKKSNRDLNYRVSIKLTLKDSTKMCNLTTNNYTYYRDGMVILPDLTGDNKAFLFSENKRTKRDAKEMDNYLDSQCQTIQHGLVIRIDKNAKIRQFGTIKIIRDEKKRYYFCLTYKVPAIDLNAKENTVAFDPGYRTFMTCADSSGNIYTIGNDMTSKLAKIANRITRIKKSKASNGNRKIKSLKTKANNFSQDYHCKTAKFLASKYKNIIAPELSSKFMKAKKSQQYKNYVDFISHYKFTSKLKLACESFNRNYLYTSESYTSRTCCCCGHVNDKYIEKTLDCTNCDSIMDRDINGANNILIRFLTRSV
jgi:predicted site-specific integrase-resolvase/transposase